MKFGLDRRCTKHKPVQRAAGAQTRNEGRVGTVSRRQHDRGKDYTGSGWDERETQRIASRATIALK